MCQMSIGLYLVMELLDSDLNLCANFITWPQPYLVVLNVSGTYLTCEVASWFGLGPDLSP